MGGSVDGRSRKKVVSQRGFDPNKCTIPQCDMSRCFINPYKENFA